jgi:hypothetical protein
MNEEYDRGRRDGLRLALAVLGAEEAKWAALLGESSSWRTNSVREVRHKTLQVAQRRIQTVLNRLSPKDDSMIEQEVKAALDEIGL